MITKEELAKIARINNVPLFTQEREYIQTLFLSRLSVIKESSELAFKGGTCLKLFYGSNRFSEDLDFTLVKKIDVEKLIIKAAKDLNLIGIETYVDKKSKRKDGFGCRLRYKGPLYNGKEISIGSIRIDVSFRRDVFLEPEVKILNHSYSDVPVFSTPCLNLKEIAAEKVRALLTRSKPRDVYDVWFLMKRGIEVDKNLLIRKMSVLGKKLKYKKIKIKKEEWERDLRPLLPKIISLKSVMKEINELISRITR